MDCLIFAAGLGTRLRPLTDHMPKAMVPVAGKPLLQHLLLKLQAAKIDRAVVNVHHFAEQIIDFVAQNDFGFPVQISDERACLLDTGGAVKKAAPLLTPNQPFLVHNVDIFSNLDLAKFASLHIAGSLATLLVSDRKSTRYLLFDNENRLVGWTNTTTGEVRSPYEKLDVATCKKRAFAGIHILAQQVQALMKSWPEKFSIIDFYLQNCAEHTIRGVEVAGLELIDVGKIDTLQRAERFLNDHNSLI